MSKIASKPISKGRKRSIDYIVSQKTDVNPEQQEIEDLERYILSEDKWAAIEQFPPDSQTKTVLSLIELLKAGDYDNDNFKKLWKSLDGNVASNGVELELRAKLKKYDTLEDGPEKEKILDFIQKNYLEKWQLHPKPYTTAADQTGPQYPSVFDSTQADLDSDKVAFDLFPYMSYTQKGFAKLDLMQIPDEIFQQVLQQNILMFQFNPHIIQKIANLIRNNMFQIDVEFLKFFSIEQLEELKQLVNNHYTYSITALILNKKYSQKIKQVNLKNLTDVYNLLKEIQAEVLPLPDVFKELKKSIQCQLLTVLVQIGQINQDEFLTYLSVSDQTNFNIRKRTSQQSIFQNTQMPRMQQYQQSSQGNYYEARYDDFMQPPPEVMSSINGETIQFFLFTKPMDHEKLTSYYLSELIPDLDSLAPYNEYFEEDYLRRIVATTLLTKTGVLEDVYYDILGKQLGDIVREVKLDPLPTNPLTFDADQPVKFSMTLKNVPNVNIRIYELNTLHYYKTHLKPLNTSVGLVGLVPQHQRYLEFAQNPAVKFIQEFEFPELQNRPGCYALDFIGNGKQCRIVIRIGSVKYISKLTAAGQLVWIVDEHNQVCTGEGTGAYLDGSFYPINPKGFIQLPFGNQTTVKPLIITNGTISNIYTDFQHQAEDYVLSASILLHSESFLSGNRGKMSIQLRLMLSQTRAPLELLKNLKIVVTCTSYPNVNTSKTFTNIEIPPNGQYFDLQLDAPNKLFKVQVDISGHIVAINGKKKELSYNKEFRISKHDDTQKIADAFTYFAPNGDLVVEVRGRNGELIKNTPVMLSYFHKYITFKKEQQLQTDTEGRLYIKNPNKLVSIQLALQNFHSQEVTVNLNELKPQTQYPNHIDLCYGDDFSLPFSSKQGDINNYLKVRLYSFDQKVGTGSRFEQFLTYEAETQTIRFGKLPIGFYCLVLKDNRMTIQVHDGVHWGNNQFIMNENSILQTGPQYRTLSFQKVEVEGNQLKIQLNGDYSNAFVNAVLYNFNSSNLNHLYLERLSGREKESYSEIVLKNLEAVYLPSQKMNQEYQYIIQRRKLKPIVGNILPKPQLLLNRAYQMDTSTEIQQAAKGDKLQSVAMTGGQQVISRKTGADFFPPLPKYGFSSNDSFHPDFLQIGSENIINIPVNDQGQAIIQSDLLSQFTSVLLLATNAQSNASFIQPLPTPSLQTRDLRLNETLNPEQSYTIKRLPYNIHQGEQYEIQDITSTSYGMVENLAQVIDLLPQLSSVGDGSINLSDWKFLGNWNRLSEEEKQEKYNEFQSHELNIFIYLKDRDFFTRNIEGYLRNKIQKQLIDKWLLGEELREYAELSILDRLNTIEFVLFIHRCAQWNQDLAANLCQGLGDKANHKRRDQQTKNKFNKRIDLIANIVKDKDEDDEDSADSIGIADKMEDDMQMAMDLQMQEEDDFMPFGEGYFNNPMMGQNNMFGNQPMLMNQQPMLQQAMLMNQNMMVQNAMLPKQQIRNVQSTLNSRQMNSMFSNRTGAAPRMASRAQRQPSINRNRREERKASMSNSMSEDDAASIAYSVSYPQEDDIMELRKRATAIQSKGEATKQYAETTYYKVHGQAYVAVNALSFWYEVAQNLIQGNLQTLSYYFIEVANATEALIMLAFLDLPYDLTSHARSIKGTSVSIQASSNFMIFLKSTQVAEFQPNPDILISYKFTDQTDYYIDEFGKRTLRPQNRFLTHTVYNCEVTVTNTSDHNVPINVLMQIPGGSMPVNPPENTKVEEDSVGSFTSKKYNMQVYFPQPGDFILYPPNVSTSEHVLAKGQNMDIMVRSHYEIEEFVTFKEIAVSGNVSMVMDYLYKHGIEAAQEEAYQCYWMLENFDFFKQLTDFYRSRRYYDSEVWAFSMYHRDLQTMREYSEDNIKGYVGPYFTSSLITTKELNFQHVEFDPLINARVHKLGDQPKLANSVIRKTYTDYLKQLCYKPEIDLFDKLILCQYLIYQERINEAKELFASIPLQPSTEQVGQSTLQLQYDLMACYLDFELGQRVAPLYANYPVTSWRDKFAAVLKQYTPVTQVEKVKEDPTLVVEIVESQLRLNYSLIQKATIKFYPMDLEVIFSLKPFFDQAMDEIAVIPVRELVVEFEEARGNKVIEIPEDLSSLTLYIEIDYGLRSVVKTYFPTKLKVHIEERNGMLKVVDSSLQYLPATYVKVFCRKNSGEVEFYKDGYTDAIGRFDYVTLNTNQLQQVSRFAILVSHPDLGEIRVEASPPPKSQIQQLAQL